MKTASDRLIWARERAGFETAREAAESLGVPASTYYNHEAGNRGFEKDAAKYARRFKVSAGWLVYGTGPAPEDAPPPDPIPEIYSDQVVAKFSTKF